MKQGKRYIRNSVFVLYAVTVLGTCATRLYASAVDKNTPQWLRNVMSLGMVVKMGPAPGPPAKVVQLSDAGQLHFTQISVDGDFAVELISAPEHNVTLTPVNGQAWSMDIKGQRDGLLTIKGGAGTEGAVLRIEAPALTSIDAKNLRQLTIRGWKSPKLTIRMKKVAGARLEENTDGHWILHSDTPIVMEADEATLSAGYNIQASGQIRIHGPRGNDFNFTGTGGQVSLKRIGK